MDQLNKLELTIIVKILLFKKITIMSKELDTKIKRRTKFSL